MYDGELEMQPQYAAFQDRLRTFELWKGKKTEDPDHEKENYVGKFKVRLELAVSISFQRLADFLIKQILFHLYLRVT